MLSSAVRRAISSSSTVTTPLLASTSTPIISTTTAHTTINSQLMSTVASGNEEPEVVVDQTSTARIVTLNRPKALNALNLSMCETLLPAYRTWAHDKNVSLVILRGSGEKAFCAGGDVKAMVVAAGKGDVEAGRAFFHAEYSLDYTIATLGKPHIALLDGITMGGGVGLSVHSPFRIATERTVFAMPETAIGLFPDVGGTYFLPRLPGAGGTMGMFLGLTGHRLKGYDVVSAGIATHYVPSHRIPDLTARLSSLIHPSHETVAEAIAEFGPADDLPSFSLAPFDTLISTAFSAETVEGILESLDGFASASTSTPEEAAFAAKAAKTLRAVSPTSLRVTQRQIREGAKLNLAEAFGLEYRLANRSLDADLGHDFIEGVTALLVDKGRKPEWKPASLDETPASRADQFFAPLPGGELKLIRGDQLKASL